LPVFSAAVLRRKEKFFPQLVARNSNRNLHSQRQLTHDPFGCQLQVRKNILDPELH